MADSYHSNSSDGKNNGESVDNTTTAESCMAVSGLVFKIIPNKGFFEIKINLEDTIENLRNTITEKLNISNQDVSLRHKNKLIGADWFTECGIAENITIWFPASFETRLLYTDCNPTTAGRLRDIECDSADCLNYNENKYQVAPQNAILNDVVVREFVKYLRRRDLSVCRKVCKKWNQNILSRFRKTFKIRFEFDKPCDYSRFEDFVLLMHSSEEIPFGDFTLDGLPQTATAIDNFLFLCGPSLKELTLNKERNVNISNLLRYLMFNAPFLESLTVHEFRYDIESMVLFPNCYVHPDLNPPKMIHLNRICYSQERLPQWTRESLVQLFTAACNLVDIEFVSSEMIVEALMESGNFIKLKKLSLLGLSEINLKLVIHLSKKGMKLVKLGLNLLQDVTKKSMEELLSYHKDSLKDLRLNSLGHIQLQLPQMVNLRKFTIPFHLPNSRSVVYTPVAYGKQFPSLTELRVPLTAREVDWDNDFSLTVNAVPCVSLRRLRMPHHMNNPNMFRRLANLFPYIKRLEIRVNIDRMVPLSWQTWPNLESLRIDITGVEDVDYLFLHGRTRASNVFDNTPHNSISALKRLKALRIISSLLQPNQRLSCLPSDDFAYNVLKSMSQLNELYIDQSQISLKCFKEIRPIFSPQANIKIQNFYQELYTI